MQDDEEKVILLAAQWLFGPHTGSATEPHTRRWRPEWTSSTHSGRLPLEHPDKIEHL